VQGDSSRRLAGSFLEPESFAYASERQIINMASMLLATSASSCQVKIEENLAFPCLGEKWV
jgi:hypothetical protein